MTPLERVTVASRVFGIAAILTQLAQLFLQKRHPAPIVFRHRFGLPRQCRPQSVDNLVGVRAPFDVAIDTDLPGLRVEAGGLLVLYMFGIGKAALMPFHRWLPAAWVAPTPVSALLHAVAVVKAGVFSVVKIVVYVFGADASGASFEWLVWVAYLLFALGSAWLFQQEVQRERVRLNEQASERVAAWADLGAADIGPDRLNLSLELNRGGRLSGRVQAFRFFDRTFCDADGEATAGFDGYDTVDSSLALDLGASTLTLSAANLLDAQYITYFSQAATNLADRYFAGRGRTLTLRVESRF